jgi:trehalose 6-phosphate synthase/phosphatase
VLESRYRGVSKATVVERIVRSEGPLALLVAFGDDRTDEEMFSALPHNQISIHVGQGPSCARFGLSDTAAVRELLHRLATDHG